MSSPQHGIFTKSNLVYIPLSITVAHISNFIINSPSSTWQEFPPMLPNSIYLSTFLTPLLLFISLTFEPIQTRKRFYALLSLTFIFASIPISYRGKYPSSLHNPLVSIATFFGLKMLLFLKLNRAYLNQKKSDQKKDFKSYLWSLFNWRLNVYIIPPNSENSSLIIKSPTNSQVIAKLIDRFMAVVPKWLLFELTFFISFKYGVEIPEKSYPMRSIEFITKGIPPVTMTLVLQYFNFMVFIYSWASLTHDIFIIVATILFRLFFYSKPEKNNNNHILIRSGLLTPSEYISLNEWFVTFIFNTKHMFNEPWLSSSPRDFWSVRWQLSLKEILQELGFLPARDLFAPILPRKIANMIGVFGAFGISALLHEYLLIGDFDQWGTQYFPFMMHGVIFVLWEAVFGNEKKIVSTKIKIFLKWVLLMVINLIFLPAALEPTRNKLEFSEIPSLFAKYYR